jgi:Rrf2 family protein
MLSLSQTTGYAIKTLTHLGATKDEYRLVRDLSRSTGVPAAYLSKIVRRLVEAGIVEARRGHKGGVRLARPAKKISVYDIGEAIEGADVVGNCLLGETYCLDLQQCPTRRFWRKARKEIQAELKRWTLADLIVFARKHSCKRK